MQRRYLCLMGLAGVMTTLSQAAMATTMGVTGVYDENTYVANAVDSSLTTYTVAQFKPDVAAAYAAGKGGVIGFDSIGTNNFNNYGITDGVLSATVGSMSLNINVPTSSGVAFALGSASPISGGPNGAATAVGAFAGGNADTAGTVNDMDFVFGIPTGLSASDRVTAVGLTYLGRTSVTGNTIITAYFSGGTSTSVTTTAVNGSERFAGFAAPAGEYITHVLVDSPTNARRVFIDDLGFITSPIPEPTSLALLGVAGVLLGRRRQG